MADTKGNFFVHRPIVAMVIAIIIVIVGGVSSIGLPIVISFLISIAQLLNLCFLIQNKGKEKLLLKMIRLGQILLNTDEHTP